MDLRVIEDQSYAAALQYFTGSKEHNIALRKEAIKKGCKLNEYGLFEDSASGARVPCQSEEEIYDQLGMDYVPPELRENRGEIEAAKAGKLPVLITQDDIRGDFHLHTKYSDGTASIQGMAEAAEKLNYEYVAITDHSPSARFAGGMKEDKIREQWKDIDKIAENYSIKILKGAEVDILKDGSLDYPAEILKELDVVIGSIHSSFKMAGKRMTQRMQNALANEYIDILGHPTGRLIGKRPPIEADFAEIFEAAAEKGVMLEINSQPERMDLNDAYIIAAKERGALFCIDTDSRSPLNLGYMRYGLGLARRGWLEKKDVINAYPYSGLKHFFKRL